MCVLNWTRVVFDLGSVWASSNMNKIILYEEGNVQWKVERYVLGLHVTGTETHDVESSSRPDVPYWLFIILWSGRTQVIKCKVAYVPDDVTGDVLVFVV